jgi:hypothetical protein
MAKNERRFDRLLCAMATQPEPSEKQQGDNQASGKAGFLIGEPLLELSDGRTLDRHGTLNNWRMLILI